jgi:hypothetical protein
VSNSKNENGLALLLAIVVVVHLGLSLWHGATHNDVPVPLSPLQQAFIGLVIVLLPLVGAGLLWSRWRTQAALLVALSLLGSLLFGFINHYVLDSADNVVSLPANEWRHPFVVSAALIAISESIGTALGAVAAWNWMKRRA